MDGMHKREIKAYVLSTERDKGTKGCFVIRVNRPPGNGGAGQPGHVQKALL